MRDRIRVRHYSPHIEQVYCHWVKQFTRFHRYRHPAEMGAAEVEAFLTDLAVRRKVSASMWQVERLQLADSNAPPRHVWRVSPALHGRIKPSRETAPVYMKN
ncbi:phage integrase N-terminal SAM-like domain-containing protein [Azotobacter salinestris]